MGKYCFNPKLPKAPILRIRWSKMFPGQRAYLGSRGANFFECWIGPLNILIRMPWLMSSATALHPELFTGNK